MTIITPGELVEVSPDEIDEKDTLEVAELLIDEHGHFKNDSGDETRGWSIHGAVGEAARRVTDSSGKDQDGPRALRNSAAALLLSKHGHGENVLNDDPATDKDRAMRLIREARLDLPSTFRVTPPAPTSSRAAPPTTPGGATP